MHIFAYYCVLGLLELTVCLTAVMPLTADNAVTNVSRFESMTMMH